MQLGMDNFRFVVLPRVFTFTSETPGQSSQHSAPPNPQLIVDAWWELGHTHGCDSCSLERCVIDCPSLFNKHLRKVIKFDRFGVSEVKGS